MDILSGAMPLIADVRQTGGRPNYEALGNQTPHLHWWLTPRYETDPRPFGPIWEDLEFLRALWTSGSQPAPDQRDQLRRRILDALQDRDIHIEQTWDPR